MTRRLTRYLQTPNFDDFVWYTRNNGPLNVTRRIVTAANFDIDT